MARVSATTRERWQRARPDLDTSPMEIIGPLKRLQGLLDLAMEPLYDGAAVTPAELDVLIHLRHADEPVIARQLSRSLNCSRAAISKTLARLELRGYLVREANPSDRRAALVRLTDPGAEVVDAMFPRQLAAEAALLAGLTPAGRRTVADALGLLLDAVRER
ncbi:MAG TPA: winged helix DNA-binding protein [Rugosimonospora sp.]|nr:winged helix DNA-binding protein [Rugosimonospora sp.]